MEIFERKPYYEVSYNTLEEMRTKEIYNTVTDFLVEKIKVVINKMELKVYKLDYFYNKDFEHFIMLIDGIVCINVKLNDYVLIVKELLPDNLTLSEEEWQAIYGNNPRLPYELEQYIYAYKCKVSLSVSENILIKYYDIANKIIDKLNINIINDFRKSEIDEDLFSSQWNPGWNIKIII